MENIFSFQVHSSLAITWLANIHSFPNIKIAWFAKIHAKLFRLKLNFNTYLHPELFEQSTDFTDLHYKGSKSTNCSLFVLNLFSGPKLRTRVVDRAYLILNE